jgi:precorrin-6x reductase
MKEEIINRDKKKEEEEAESQHLGLGGTKEGKEAGVELGWSSKATFLSSTQSRKDLEEEASPTRLGRHMPDSWMISKYIQSKSPQSLENITL